MHFRATWLCALVACCLIAGPRFVAAALTPELRKEIADVKKELDKVNRHISKKEFDEAEKIIDAAEGKLKAIAKTAGIEENDRAVAGIFRLIELKKVGLEKKSGKDIAGVSFSKEIGPILAARCLNCHGDNNPRANLQLDTFAGLEKGGANGPLLTIGNPNTSLIMQRVTSNTRRMPPGNGPGLTALEIQKLSAWISQGAKYDGVDKNSRINANVADEPAGPAKPPIAIARATGTETVSFVSDIAPFMTNLCLGCHSGNNARSGFSLETFELLMKGGRSGRVVLPGNLQDSRLWHLTGLQDPIKMPPGQALITRTNWNNLKTWIEEGAKFDGDDPKARLSTLVPTSAENRAKELAAMSSEDFQRLRKNRSDEMWKMGLSKETPKTATTAQFLIYGNVAPPRLKEIGDWAEEAGQTLKQVFGVKDATIWRGKLAIHVFSDRFSYEEFTRTIEELEVPREAHGHAKVTPTTQEEAYICLEDVGDESNESRASLRSNLMEQLTDALLKRNQNRLPGWLGRGTALALAARANPDGEYFSALSTSAIGVAKDLQNNPQDLFAPDKFAPSEFAAVSYSLVSYMISVGGEQKFVQFVTQLQTNNNLGAALNSVYSVDQQKLANVYVGTMLTAKPVKKKKP